jgi:hypothetical protein
MQLFDDDQEYPSTFTGRDLNDPYENSAWQVYARG